MKLAIAITTASLVLAPSIPWTDAAFPADVQALMDPTVDPCDDFYQYTCGGWLKNYTLPPTRGTYSYSFDGIGVMNEELLNGIANESWPLVGELWDSCLAVDRLTANGSRALQPTLRRLQSATSKRALLQVAGEVDAFEKGLFVKLAVGGDSQDPLMNVLKVGAVELTMPAKSYYLEDESFKDVEPAFRKYIAALLTLSGQVSNSVGVICRAQEIIIRIEKKLAALLPDEDEQNDPVGFYNPLQYGTASKRFSLTFAAFVDGLQLTKRTSMTASSRVVFAPFAYFDGVEKLLATTSLEDLKLYAAFAYVHHHASYLGEPFLKASFEFLEEKLNGVTERPPRSKVCVDAQLLLLPDLVGKYYALKMFDNARRDDVQTMVQDIEHAMGEHIAGLEWLDASTREAARAKLAKVTNAVGTSTQKKSYPVVLKRDDYIGNALALLGARADAAVAKIGKPVDRAEWEISGAEVNAYYTAWENKMVFPAAILQPPFYRGPKAHPAQNYGAIGMVIGHELTHGFDSSGRLFDGDGRQRDWWSVSTTQEFETRATCLRRQYSEMVVLGENQQPLGYVDGNLTVTENIADNGGLGLAWDAYRRRQAQSSGATGEKISSFEADRLFFVSFGQVWCTAWRDEFLKRWMETDVHAPDVARVNGPVRNSPAFARTFQCPVGAKMNPATKCQLW